MGKIEPFWSQSIRGSDITNEFLNNLSTSPGVYIWRRCIRLEPESILRMENFENWLAKALSASFVRTNKLTLSPKFKNLSIRANFMRLEAFEIGGGVLSQSKVRALRDYGTIPTRLDLYHLLQITTEAFGPTLYVGETDCIRTRVKDHVSTNSPYRERLAELGLDLEDTILNYHEMPDSSQKERQLLEQILSHLLVAPLTRRAG